MSEFLPVFVQNALEDNEELLPLIASAHPDAAKLLEFCRNFRLAGIGLLFLTGDGAELRRRLSQSARAFVRYVGVPGVTLPALGRAAPVFDAIAAGDVDAARAIARSPRRGWAQGEEYEEDHLFPEFLIQRFLLGSAGASALLDRWEAALQGSDDARLPVCRALHAADGVAFDAAIRRFLDDRRSEMEGLAETGALDPFSAATEAHLDVTGVALVRLARAAGLPTDADYPRVPSPALEDGAISFSPDSWRSVGA